MAEQEVGLKLQHIYGSKKVKQGLPGYSGTNGEPDILLITEHGLIFIEVKSAIPFFRRLKKVKGRKRKKTYYRANTIKLNRQAWNNLLKTAREKHAHVMVIVEMRLKDANVYFHLTKKQVQRHVNETDAEWVHIPIHFLCRSCHVLQFTKEEFNFEEELNTIKQKSGQQRLE
jgi:hypothetical protein